MERQATPSTTDPDAKDATLPRWVWITLSVCAVLTIAFAVWYTALRDTWESDNAYRITELCHSIEQAAADRDEALVVSQHDTLTQLIGTRQLRNASLSAAVTKANQQATPIRDAIVHRKKAEEEAADAAQFRNQLNNYAALATSLESEGKLEQAKSQLDAAIDLLSQRTDRTTRFGDIGDALASQRANVAAKIADLREQEQQERLRQEKAVKLASIKGSIEGGAWVTKKGGSSDILRGLKVCAIQSRCSSATSMIVINALAKQNMESNDDWEKTAAAFRSAPSGLSLPASAPILFLPSEPLTHSVQEALSSYLKQLQVAEATANIDGKFTLSVPGGEWFIFAEWQSSFSRIVWCVPVEITNEQPVHLDLSNENALTIWNKD